MADGSFLQPVSAMLTRTLAEAAAGYPGAGEIYLVASYTRVPPERAFYGGMFDVQPAFPSYQDAQDWIEANGVTGYGIFGPFESTFVTPVNPEQAQVASFSVTTTAGGVFEIAESPPGDTGSPPFDTLLEVAGPEFDALFMTPGAVAKFAVPYYADLYSLGFANRVLAEFQQSSLALMGHYPWSEYTDFPEPPAGAGSGSGSSSTSGSTSTSGNHRRVAHVPVLFERGPGGEWHRRPLVPGEDERGG